MQWHVLYTFKKQQLFFSWNNEIENIRKNSFISAIGGSIIYKSAYLHGLGVTLGLYTTTAKDSLDTAETYLYKGGKDTFSRYDLLKGGSGAIVSLAQAYLEYRHHRNTLRIGVRFIPYF